MLCACSLLALWRLPWFLLNSFQPAAWPAVSPWLRWCCLVLTLAGLSLACCAWVPADLLMVWCARCGGVCAVVLVGVVGRQLGWLCCLPPCFCLLVCAWLPFRPCSSSYADSFRLSAQVCFRLNHYAIVVLSMLPTLHCLSCLTFAPLSGLLLLSSAPLFACSYTWWSAALLGRAITMCNSPHSLPATAPNIMPLCL